MTRRMEGLWNTGKKQAFTWIYWTCDVKAPCFDNSLPPVEQIDNMMSLISTLKVKNHKDFPTQVFVKERNKQNSY
jgi:hypothetical protein